MSTTIQLITRVITTMAILSVQLVTRAQLYPDDPDISDGPCRKVEAMKNFSAILPVLMEPIQYSVYLANHVNLHVYASTLLGRRPWNQEEVEEMCFNFLFFTPLCVQTGYVNQTFTTAAVMGDVPGKVKFFKKLSHTEGVKMKYLESVRETFMWSNGVNHTLFAQCLNNKYMAWKLVSTVMPTDDIKELVLGIVERNGFNRSNAVDLRPVQSNCNPVLPNRNQALVQTLKNYKLLPSDV